jgi:hypothetical protein
MLTKEEAKVKNDNNDDIFQFFLEYQRANEQQEEQERGIAYIHELRESLENLKVGLNSQ